MNTIASTTHMLYFQYENVMIQESNLLRPTNMLPRPRGTSLGLAYHLFFRTQH